MRLSRGSIWHTPGLILALAVASGFAGSFCRAGTIHPAPGAPLQAAVSAAGRGDTVVVHGGRYEGNVSIEKPVTLIGEGDPLISGTGSGSVVTIAADSCTVRGFRIERSGTMLAHEDAGILVKSSHNRIEGCSLRDVLFGIYLLRAENNIVADNHIAGRLQLDPGDRGNGIHVWDSRRNRLIGNIITGMRDGIYIQNAAHTWIEGNNVSDLRYGLHYMYADSNTFLKNIFHNNIAGAAVMYSRGIRIRHNAFIHNRGFSSYGILFQDCHDVVADSNIIADNEVGMFLEASTGNAFRDNLVARNDIALAMFQNSVNNVFTRNGFLDNIAMLQLIGKRTDSRWSENGIGNYWSDYDGYDLDRDGRGDIPMKIQDAFQYLEARNRNFRLYLYSPISQALGAATKAFPVLVINNEQDPAPLMRSPRVASWPAMLLVAGSRSAARRAGWPAATVVALPLLAVVAGGAAYRHRKRKTS